jgi:predicted ATP-grasp superfamily ATP-dependent carboligase
MGETVLLVDENSRAGLAAIRSLGRAGTKVIVASNHPSPLAAASKYCSNFQNSPSFSDVEKFHHWLIKLLEDLRPTALFPVTDKALELCLGVEKEIKKISAFPFISSDLFLIVNSKRTLLEKAKSLGINTPRTLEVNNLEQLEQLQSFNYPVVFKSNKLSSNKAVKVRYFKSFDELSDTIKSNPEELQGSLFQEYIEGSGVGVFALCHNGQVFSSFCHRRLLEKPPSGGVSVLSESISTDNAPVVETKKLLQALNWHGIAMVEFKKSTDGNFYLMEINPRFWGSLQLAIDCKRDFPFELYQFATCADKNSFITSAITKNESMPYLISKRLRWELGTLDHLIANTKDNLTNALCEVFFNNSLYLFSSFPSTKLEVFRFSDPRPFFRELQQWLLPKNNSNN